MGSCVSVVKPENKTHDYVGYLEDTFPSVNSVDSLELYSNFAKISIMSWIKTDMLSTNYIDEYDMLTTGTKPFNVFARLAANVMPNKADQSVIGRHQHSFVICHNKPENDERWNDESFAAASMAGPDENGPGHVFLTTKNLHWSYFNVLTIVVFKRYEFLVRLKSAALLYTDSRGWTNPGFFFHAFPHNSVNSLHLHIVNLDNVGFNYWNNTRKNLSIDDAITVSRIPSADSPPYIDNLIEN